MAWSKASVAKMLETRRKNKALKTEKQGSVAKRMKTAATYLQQAEHKMKKPYTEAELYALLALRVLTTK